MQDVFYWRVLWKFVESRFVESPSYQKFIPLNLRFYQIFDLHNVHFYGIYDSMKIANQT